jgi:hypothetical protein
MISGATSTTYTLSTSGVPTGAYSFKLNVTDSTSSPFTVTSSAISVTVNSALAAPTASGPPAANQGQAFTLSSTAVTTGTSPYTYQWFSKAPSANSYSAIADAISPSYNYITSATTTLGSWNFILQVTDALGSAVNSTAIAIPVNTALVAPSIIAYTSAITVGAGGTTLASTIPTTGSTPYSYQWFAKAPYSDYATVGSDSSTYNFAGAIGTATGSWNFVVQVTDASGAAVNSTNVAVTVNPAPVITPTPIPTPTHSPSPSPSPTASPTPKPTSSSPTPTASSNSQTNSNIMPILYGLVVIIAVAVVATAVIAIRRKNKKSIFQ